MDICSNDGKENLTGLASKDVQCGKHGPVVKQEAENVFNIFYIAKTERLMFKKSTKASYKVFEEVMKPYYLVYTSGCHKFVKKAYKATFWSLKEFIDLLLTHKLFIHIGG